MRNVPILRYGGYTIIELVIVVAILGVIAAVAVPSMSSGTDARLRLAADDVAGAIRYARSEAIRTRDAHGVTISQVTQKVTVEKYDLTTAPISVLFTMTQPVDKRPYDFNVNTRSTTQDVTISNSQDPFNYTGLGRRQSLIFDGYGTPKWIVGSAPTTHLLVEGVVELSLGNRTLSVNIDPITGRVTVQ